MRDSEKFQNEPRVRKRTCAQYPKPYSLDTEIDTFKNNGHEFKYMVSNVFRTLNWLQQSMSNQIQLIFLQ